MKDGDTIEHRLHGGQYRFWYRFCGPSKCCCSDSSLSANPEHECARLETTNAVDSSTIIRLYTRPVLHFFFVLNNTYRASIDIEHTMPQATNMPEAWRAATAQRTLHSSRRELFTTTARRTRPGHCSNRIFVQTELFTTTARRTMFKQKFQYT